MLACSCRVTCTWGCRQCRTGSPPTPPRTTPPSTPTSCSPGSSASSSNWVRSKCSPLQPLRSLSSESCPGWHPLLGRYSSDYLTVLKRSLLILPYSAILQDWANFSLTSWWLGWSTFIVCLSFYPFKSWHKANSQHTEHKSSVPVLKGVANV